MNISSNNNFLIGFANPIAAMRLISVFRESFAVVFNLAIDLEDCWEGVNV